jgi:hypothetical protein
VHPPLRQLLVRQEQVITRGQALRFISDRTIRHALECGRWRHLHTGIYLTHNGPLTASQRSWLAVLAASDGRCAHTGLGGLSALLAWGLNGVTSDCVHVLAPHSRRTRMPPGARLHRTRIAPDLATHLRPPATYPGRSLIEAAAWARTDREATLIVATSFQQSMVTLADVRRAATELTTARRRSLVLTVAEDCADGSHSLGELDLLALCRESGLPEPSRQVLRHDREGRRRYVDALWDEWMLAVEVDGAHHLLVDQMWDDAVKSNALQLDGYVVLRYPAFAIRTRGKQIAAEIREALRRRGWELG